MRKLVLLLLLSACTGTVYAPVKPEISAYGKVSAPKCERWNDPLTVNAHNSTLPDYGCAHAANLVNELEDKSDLIAPPMGNAATSGETAAKAVEAYHNGTDVLHESSATSESSVSSGGGS